ncbi:hypothetical protein MRS44_006060 [Fusarium solani]|uniref:uncharacterized protein n=1 Tax=Fusarium solani TaxID=169388 RepID=UPI0032C49F88|nr:hypothetical protein MRS44_006060 [Fusarium solani]
MTRGFRNMLVESDVEELARAILQKGFVIFSAFPTSPQKRGKFEDRDTDETVEDWIKYRNTHVPVNDPDLRRFQAGIQSLIKKLID